MSTGTVSRWSRRFVGSGATFLVCWSVVALAGLGRRPEVTLALYGFVLTTVFGKAYALVPAYFDRSLAFPRAPAVQFPLTVLGVVALAAHALGVGPDSLAAAGAAAWTAGVAVFLAAMGWTLRDNPTGAETGTGDHQADRRAVDRYANAFVPVVLGYLAVGSYDLVAVTTPLPAALARTLPQVSHLLGAGVAALLVFAVGFRLFPRFLVARPPRPLVWLVLPAGAVGPALVAAGVLGGGPVLLAGAVAEAVAVVGFALAYGVLFARSDRRRVGFYAVLVAVVAGVLAVSLGVQFALVGRSPSLVTSHFRFALVGFLGLTIVGAAMQFYPPTVGDLPGATDRTAGAVVALIAGGLGLGLADLLAPPLAVAGDVAACLGTLGYAYVLFGAFLAR